VDGELRLGLGLAVEAEVLADVNATSAHRAARWPPDPERRGRPGTPGRRRQHHWARQRLLTVGAEHLGGDLGAHALEGKSARLGARAQRGHVTAELLLRPLPDEVIVTLLLHCVGDLTGLRDNLVVGLLLLGGYGPVLGLGQLGDLAGLANCGRISATRSWSRSSRSDGISLLK